jgi:hypothetical protein
LLVALLISAALGMEWLTPRKLTAVALTVATIAVLTQALGYGLETGRAEATRRLR